MARWLWLNPRRVAGVGGDYLVDSLELAQGLRAVAGIKAGDPLRDAVLEEGMVYTSMPEDAALTRGFEDATHVDVTLTMKGGSRVELERVWEAHDEASRVDLVRRALGLPDRRVGGGVRLQPEPA